MGLDTRQPRASRDGGVDCIAVDPRPIMAGKVVIQAKRYRQDRSFRTCLACTVRDADPHRGHTASGVVVRENEDHRPLRSPERATPGGVTSSAPEPIFNRSVEAWAAYWSCG
jgi:Restriction endonuclease